jgi:predicted nucleic acid-binding protein
LILVDSSVWIDFFSSAPGRAGGELRRMISDAEPFALSGVIITEIVQGLTRDASRIGRYLTGWDLLEPGGFLAPTPKQQRFFALDAPRA